MTIALDITDLVSAKRRGRPGPNGVERVTRGLLEAARETGRLGELATLFLDDDRKVRLVDLEQATALLTSNAKGLNGEDIGRPARPGDFGTVLLSGASWINGRLQHIHAALAHMKPALVPVVHDMIPFTHPHFVSPHFAEEYRRWIGFAVATSRRLLVPSQASRRSMEQIFPESAERLRVIPLGVAAGPRAPGNRADGASPAPILYVSSVVPRKNHEMLVRAWRAAFAGMRRKDVPPLAIAGSCRWKTALRLKLLAGALHGKLHIRGNIDDRELEALVDRAGFIVFPSHAEGWGLPVSEALARGKTGLVSTALPEEADQNLLPRIAPDDTAAWAREIRRLAADAGLRRAREDEVRRRFRPGQWQDTLSAVLAACQ